MSEFLKTTLLGALMLGTGVGSCMGMVWVQGWIVHFVDSMSDLALIKMAIVFALPIGCYAAGCFGRRVLR